MTSSETLSNFSATTTAETSVFSYYERNLTIDDEIPVYHVTEENTDPLPTVNSSILGTQFFSSLIYNISDGSNYEDDNLDDVADLATVAINDVIRKGSHIGIVPTVSSTASSYISSSVPDLLNRNNSYLTVRNVSSLECLSQNIPSVGEYLTAINIAGVTIFTLGAVAVLFILYMYIDTLKHIMKNSPALVKTHSAFVLSVYPVVAVTTYCAIVVPRAHLLAEAMTQGIFMASLYQLFCLFVAYCGGEAELIRRVKPDSLNLKVPPCCCWPCCFFLPLLPVNKVNVKFLRLLVLQLPVVQGLVYMVLLVMWAEGESLYQVNYMYMQPVIIVSILCGIWGMIMTMTMLEDALKDHHIKAKFLVLQLVLLLAKFQGLLARFAVWGNMLPCNEPITPPVYANLIYNSSMLWEMIILGAIARQLYKRPITDPSEISKSQMPSHICTVIPCTHDFRITEGNYNRRSNNERNNNIRVIRF